MCPDHHDRVIATARLGNKPPPRASSTVGSAAISCRVKMEMIGMKPVGLWSQHSAKRTAGRPPHLAQSRAIPARVPPSQHCDLASRIQLDPRNINCTAERMFRQPPRGRRIPVATRIMRHDAHGCDPAAFAADRRLCAIHHPCLKRLGRATIHGGLRRQAHARHGLDPHSAFNTAGTAPVDPTDCRALNVRVAAYLTAKPCSASRNCRPGSIS